MGISKIQRSKEKMRSAAKQSKQTSLDRLPKAPQTDSAKAVESKQKKEIIITEIGTVTREDELALEVGFRLLPSRISFSKVKADLYFDGQKLKTVWICVLQGPLATDDFEFAPVLDMKGINAGSHVIKVEMYELWSSGEKLTCVSKVVAVEYVPQRREDRLIRVPIVKSIAGTGLEIVSDSEKDTYRQIEQSMKRELISKRDEY